MFLPLLYAKVLLLPVNYFLKLSYLLIHITISFMFLLLLKFIFFKFRAVKINLFVKFLLLTFALNLTLRYFVYSLLFLLFVLSIFFQTITENRNTVFWFQKFSKNARTCRISYKIIETRFSLPLWFFSLFGLVT